MKTKKQNQRSNKPSETFPVNVPEFIIDLLEKSDSVPHSRLVEHSSVRKLLKIDE